MNQSAWAIDTEWGYKNRQKGCESALEPIVFCAVNINTGQRRAFWGRDPALKRFLQEHKDAIFISHVSQAEMKNLLRLEIDLPQHWFDTYVAFRFIYNKPTPHSAALSDALIRLGFPHLVTQEKSEIRGKILNLELDLTDEQTRNQVKEYCFNDCIGCQALYDALRQRVPLELMNYWTEYVKTVAKSELLGLPIDLPAYKLILKHRAQIIAGLAEQANQTFPVFLNKNGLFSFSKQNFLRWCKKAGLRWPTTLSPSTN
jgi:hypothetical protein